MPLTYRQLPSYEWGKLQEQFEKHGGGLPRPDLAKIVVAEDEGRIVGFVVLQLTMHLEPIWLDEGSKAARHALSRLVHMAEESLPKESVYYAFSADDHVADLCKAFALEELEYRVFMKEVV